MGIIESRPKTLNVGPLLYEIGIWRTKGYVLMANNSNQRDQDRLSRLWEAYEEQERELDKALKRIDELEKENKKLLMSKNLGKKGKVGKKVKVIHKKLEQRYCDYQNLDVWKDSIKLTKKVIEITKYFPPKDDNELKDLLIKAANSVSSKISEGSGTGSQLKFVKQLKSARIALNDTISFLAVSNLYNFITDAVKNDLTNQAESIQINITKIIDDLD
jgi:four helix bundle protein